MFWFLGWHCAGQRLGSRLTELFCAGCVHDLKHHLSSLFLRVSQLRFAEILLGGAIPYIHVDRFAICILDGWVISFNKDALDELRFGKEC